MNSRRKGGVGSKAAALPTKQRETRGGTALETEKRAAKHKEPMPARAGGLWASMWRRLRPADTGSIQKYAATVPVVVVCRLSRRGYDVRHRGAQWNT